MAALQLSSLNVETNENNKKSSEGIATAWIEWTYPGRGL